MAHRDGKSLSGRRILPVLTAIWFAALLGLGSLAAGREALESTVAASGIDLLFPQAAPPLGMNARAGIAVALALCGGIVGFVLASFAACIRRPMRARHAHPDAPARRPIFAHEELGEDSLDMPAPLAPAASTPVAPAPFNPIPEPVRAAAADRRSPPPGEAVRRILAAELDTLSHLELVERLAIAMQRWREGDAHVAPSGPVIPACEVDLVEDEGVVNFPDHALRSAARLRDRGGLPPNGAAESSVTDLRRNAIETEKALRSALASLQRTSGAA